jgi:putative flippase GtrA
MSQHISSQFLRFCIVGTLGFIVDAGSLYLIMAWWKWGPYSSRLLSFLIAATATWGLNRTYTFEAASGHSIHYEWLKYLGYASIGGTINYATYVVCLLTSDMARLYPIIGVAAGSITGLAFNFTASRHFVFGTAKAKQGAD